MAVDFHYSFGFRNSNRSLAFYRNSIVMFAAGKLCILFDLDSGVQTHFQFAERAEVSTVVRCGILVAGALRGSPPSVCLFNTLTETQKFYPAPPSIESDEFTCLSVSVNLKFVIAQGGSPDWLLVVWLSQTREIVATFHPATAEGASVYDISFHEGGRDEFVVVGDNVFKLYEYQDEADKPLFEEIVFEKFEKSSIYHTIGWPQKQNLVVGSSKGELLFFRGIELVHEINLQEDVTHLNSVQIGGRDRAATSAVVTPQQLVCIFAGIVVLVYDGEEISFYTLTKCVFLLPDRPTRKIPGESNEKFDHLVSVVVSLDDKDLIATTRDGQMLRCPEFADGDQHRYFDTVFPRQHNDPVIGIDVSRSRPLIVSYSQRALILWNYSDKKGELRKIFRNEINSAAIHPTGLYVALAFDHYCRVLSVLYNELRDRDLILCKNCSRIGFSTAGHLLAIVSESIIEIHSFVTTALLFKLDGHAGLITSFDWIEHDTRLVSCDNRGVVCKWDLVSTKKIWETTAVLSYSSVATNRIGNTLVVGSDSKVRCFDPSSSLLWILECGKEVACATFCSDGESFYAGTSDGCVEFYNYPLSDEKTVVYAHSGTISGMKYNFKCDFLVTSGSDGNIFLWKQTEKTDHSAEGIFSDLCLVDKSNLLDQRERSKQLLLSLQHADIACDCEFELKSRKHEQILGTMALNHERKVGELNAKIVRVKEEMQTILFDSDPKSDLKELDQAARQEIIDTTLRLNEAYKKTNSYADETNSIAINYEKTIDALAEKNAEFTFTESAAIKRIANKVKATEKTLVSEKKVGAEMLLAYEEYQKKSEKDVAAGARHLSDTERVSLEKKEGQSNNLRLEIENLKQLTAFKVRDNRNLRNITAGQVDFDIKEKVDAITLLKKEFRKLEGVLDSKEKNCQKQEKKFCEMRKSVSVEKYQTVSNTTIDELVNDIVSKESRIKSCQESIKEVTNAVPRLEEEIELARELCSTVTTKLAETVSGYQRKEKVLRDTQDVISKYTATLHQCVARECNPMRLRGDILSLFEENEPSFANEDVDPRLQEEYAFQVNKLEDSYDRIKEEPSKVMRDKSMAEFRLSQKNSKILRQVHDTQKDAEKLRLVINEMETGLGLQAAQAKSNKLADELRYKIEFVLEANKRNKAERMQEIARLDAFIERQQDEIRRFQTMVAAVLRQ